MKNKLAKNISSISSPGYLLFEITKDAEHCVHMLSKQWQPFFKEASQLCESNRAETQSNLQSSFRNTAGNSRLTLSTFNLSGFMACPVSVHNIL